MMRFKQTLFRGLTRLRLLPDNLTDVSELDRFRGLEKQLDEFRELLEAIEKQTGYFSSPEGFYSIGHAETLDNYLAYLYALRFGKEPTPSSATNYLRPKPSFLLRQRRELELEKADPLSGPSGESNTNVLHHPSRDH